MPYPKRVVAAWRRHAETLIAAFPDARVEVEDIFAVEDKVAVRVKISGTQRGKFLGVSEASAGEVKIGSRLVSQAAETLHGIVLGAKKSSVLIEQIAQANREQSGALEEVTIAVRQMDEMTQHNAALVEQTNAAIEQTEAQASELDSIIDVFKVERAVGSNLRYAA